MDENLNAALNSLDMLATVTNAKYFAERRYHNNICSLSCISIPPWRTSTSNLLPTTKENQNCEKTFLYCTSSSRRQSEKFYSRRPRSRCLPYDIRRKPFHGGFNHSPSARGSSIHFPIALQHSTEHHSAHLDNELKTKTEKEKFPVPVLLFRSKSLESLDLCRDPSLRATSSCSNSEGLQLQKSNYSNCIDFIPTRGTKNLCTNNINIKKEIDSMSMRIEKLDVA